MASLLITGSSRGLGLSLVEHLLTFPPTTIGTIYATARAATPSGPLGQVIQSAEGRVKYIQLDVNNQESIKSAATSVSQQTDNLDILINNAGVQSENRATISQMTSSDLESTFSTNVTGVHLVTSAFLPLLLKGKEKKIVNVTSTLGSIGWAERSSMASVPAYKISKAALNMLTVQYAAELAPKGFTVFAISPGWLQTDLGGSYAHLKPTDGAREVVRITLEATKEKDNGSFRDIFVDGNPVYTGENPPW